MPAHGFGLGLIPAHAGKTVIYPAMQALAGAHPRSRGENKLPALIPQARQGSSPLTRGKHLASRVRSYADGLIPAHAGKTICVSCMATHIWAHPRSRGENVTPTLCTGTCLGSSPLTRGKPVGSDSLTRMEGLIPAHAGKTTGACRTPRGGRAHPRSRGENTTAPVALMSSWGSSPLTRGKPPIVGAYTITGGLIPAHAGKTSDRSGWHP